MNDYEIVKNAIDANGFVSTQTEAAYVNPTYWDKRLMDHVSANMVALQFGVDKSDLIGGDGASFDFTVLAEPASASSVAESAAVAVVKFAPTQVVLTPSEHGIAYEMSDKEMRRGFLNIMERFTADIGYGLSLQADSLAISQLQNSAGTALTAGSVQSSAIVSSDILTPTDVINAMKSAAKLKFVEPYALLVNPAQMAQLMGATAFLTAEKFGTDAAANRNGFLGKIFGIPVYMTTQIPIFTATTTNHAKAVYLAARDSFLYGFKATGGIRTQYWALLRYTDVVGVIDFDVKVARPNAIVTIESYGA